MHEGQWFEFNVNDGVREHSIMKTKSKPGTIKKVSLSTNVTPEVRAFLHSTGNASQLLDEVIRETESFRNWQTRQS